MVEMNFIYKSPALLALTILTACGPDGASSDIEPSTYVKFFDETAQTDSPILAYGVSTDWSGIWTLTGTLDRKGNRLLVPLLFGDINDARTHVDLDGGGMVTIVDGPTDFVAAFIAESSNGIVTNGVLGLETLPSELPSNGNATYVGTTNVFIDDDTSHYDLSGNARISVEFGTAGVEMLFSSLNGTKAIGSGAATNVSDVATIEIVDANITSGTISGGEAVFISSELAALSGDENVSTAGGFFGPNADEIGGVFVIDDYVDGDPRFLLIKGSFVAD